MVKLRNAICGKKNTNLDDLPHMTGKYSIFQLFQDLLLFFKQMFQDFGYFLLIFQHLFANQTLFQNPGTIYIVLVLPILFKITACLEFLHTGDVECLNGLQLKYANKTYSYRYCNMQIRYYSTLDILSWLSMVIRACLVVLDWN